MRSASPRSASSAYILLMTASMSVAVAKRSLTGTPSFSMSSSCRCSPSGSATATSSRVPSRRDRHRAQPSGVVLAQQRHDLAVELHVAELDDLDLQLLGEHLDEPALAEETELDEDVAESLARSGLGGERVAQLVLGDNARGR